MRGTRVGFGLLLLWASQAMADDGGAARRAEEAAARAEAAATRAEAAATHTEESINRLERAIDAFAASQERPRPPRKSSPH
jgi:hypothetical protein